MTFLSPHIVVANVVMDHIKVLIYFFSNIPDRFFL